MDVPKSSLSSLPSSHTHPFADLCRPALSAQRVRSGKLHFLSSLFLLLHSSKCLSLLLCPDPLLTVLLTFQGLLGKAADQPPHLIPLAGRRAPTAPQMPTETLSRPHTFLLLLEFSAFRCSKRPAITHSLSPVLLVKEASAFPLLLPPLFSGMQ